MTEARGDSGMILVEVLAALAIVAVMAGLMAGFMGQLGAVSGLERDSARQTELAAAADHLRQTLEAARALPLGIDPVPGAALVGDADSVRFTAVTRRGFRAMALRRIEFRVTVADGRRQLVQAMSPRREEPGEPDVTVVLDGLAGARFEYAAATGEFLPDWRADALPALVRITLWRIDDGRTLSAETLARLP